jgi:preprotein translocase SecE subunit
LVPVGAFFYELVHVGIYKRTQGRITRQVTFAALALTLALGLWRLGSLLQGLDPIVTAAPAQVACTAVEGRVAADGEVRIKGAAGSEIVAVRKGDSLADVAAAIDAKQGATGVAATMQGEKMELSSTKIGSKGFVQIEPAGAFLVEEGPRGADGVARGRDSLNLGLRFLIPGVLLVASMWGSYRLVNVPGFADFLIAVEAEMNKVSWPTRVELFRASMVVMILIFSLAIVLAAFDSFWRILLVKVLKIF